ncbi:MAG: hypothetical protein LC749_12345 [Actinobacteria bacterium]|nr:hypothetical protein [Actinomycetota bacterium]
MNTTPTTAQRATMNRIREGRRAAGDWEIAMTKFEGGVLQMFFTTTRISIMSGYPYDGAHASEPYGARLIGHFGTVTVPRPVDLLEQPV